MKIRPVGAKLYYADSETDGPRDRHDERNSRFSQLCERAKQQWVSWLVADWRS